MKQDQDKPLPNLWRNLQESAAALAERSDNSPIYVPPPAVGGMIQPQRPNQMESSMAMVGMAGKAVFPAAWSNQYSNASDGGDSTPITKCGSTGESVK